MSLKNIEALTYGFIRKPFYGYKEFLKIPSHYSDVKDFICDLWEDDYFKEAIFLASVELFKEWEREMMSQMLSSEKKEKLYFTIIKYYNRICTRSTPFGLFSSFSMFNFQAPYQIPQLNQSNQKRYITIGLPVLYEIVAYLCKPQFNFYHHFKMNASAYKVGHHFRFIETSYVKGVREYTLSSVERDELIDILAQEFGAPTTYSAILDFILENVEGVSHQDVKKYLDELIHSQFFKHDFDISLNSIPPLDQIINFLQKVCLHKPIDEELEACKNKLNELKKIIQTCDHFKGSNLLNYYKIQNILDSLAIQYQKSAAINVNVHESTDHSYVSQKDLKNIKTALEVVTKFSKPKNNSHLKAFENRYFLRYGDREMPLHLVLDNELGIGYLQSDKREYSFSSLLDNLSGFENDIVDKEITYDIEFTKFWSTAIKNAIKEDRNIDLQKENIPDFGYREMPRLYPETFAVMIEKVNNHILIESIGSRSALDMISRFSNETNAYKKEIQEIIDIETYDQEILHVELVHLPNQKAGNILLRNIPRNYELPYLTQPRADINVIDLHDIYIRLVKGKIVLRSKKYNKQLKIYHTSAHNYHLNSLPVYQFLCDLQNQNVIDSDLHIGELNLLCFDHIPRITYGQNLILKPAIWRLESEFFKEIEHSFEEVRTLLQQMKIPQYFYITSFDNKLLIDYNKEVLLEAFLNILKTEKQIVVRECIADPTEDVMNNEIIIPFKNENSKYFYKYNSPTPVYKVQEKFIPGDTWLYYKIYCGVKTANELLIYRVSDLVNEFLLEKLISQWFFIRYFDDEEHLRIRFKVNEIKDLGQVIDKIKNAFQAYVNDDRIWKLELSTYERELSRYAGDNLIEIENIFCTDSNLILYLLKNMTPEKLWLSSLWCIDQYLNIFEFDIADKQQIMLELTQGYQREFHAGTRVKKQIDKKYRDYFTSIDQYVNGDAISEISGELRVFFSLIRQRYQALYFSDKSLRKDVVMSILHMHINRLFNARQRMHELVLYSILEKYYRQIFHVNKIN
ncbi:hypothetical protein GNY06_01050 [Elizabethkingia argentiflava]|uniref:Lantibiotic dehydratase n=1 Tax=Elizabethkingia argenteiflava TaxID=2681556 RepID=A0A845PU80_9FLAO|nr:lantibiotic dehydratase [Elizabethkingia argenteiflava]NAW50037.1 hypothetical protein [Elizabethkingia argenteiflava]